MSVEVASHFLLTEHVSNANLSAVPKVKLCFAFILALTVVANPAHSAELWNSETGMLRDCTYTPTLPCTESIHIITIDGKRVQGIPTGRTAKQSDVNGSQLSDEYSIKGLNFEYPASDRILARVFYDGNWFQTAIEPSWLDIGAVINNFRIETPRRSTSLWCGTEKTPSYCYRSAQFNQNVMLEHRIRIPRQFVTAFVNSRTDYLEYETGIDAKSINGVEYQSIVIRMRVIKKAQVLFAALLPDPLATSDWADFETDQTIANVFSTRSRQSLSLGKCAGMPSVSVISNGLNPGIPIWDSSLSALTVAVSGPHFQVNGEVNRGFFQAKVSSELGKCLWGFDLSLKTSAVVTITESDGGIQEILTIMGHYDGRQYILTANNFHYSSNTIAIRLVQEKQVLTRGELATKFATCKELRKLYQFGIARDKKSKGVTKASISRTLYRLNFALDFNRDGVACERK